MESEDAVKRFKAIQTEEVATLRERLAKWIHANDGRRGGEPPIYAPLAVSMTAALLETAIDRKIELLGGEDALDLINRCFQRRLAAYRKTLQ